MTGTTIDEKKNISSNRFVWQGKQGNVVMERNCMVLFISQNERQNKKEMYVTQKDRHV
jgi:hypothetical protein